MRRIVKEYYNNIQYLDSIQIKENLFKLRKKYLKHFGVIEDGFNIDYVHGKSLYDTFYPTIEIVNELQDYLEILIIFKEYSEFLKIFSTLIRSDIINIKVVATGEEYRHPLTFLPRIDKVRNLDNCMYLGKDGFDMEAHVRLFLISRELISKDNNRRVYDMIYYLDQDRALDINFNKFQIIKKYLLFYKDYELELIDSAIFNKKDSVLNLILNSDIVKKNRNYFDSDYHKYLIKAYINERNDNQLIYYSTILDKNGLIKQPQELLLLIAEYFDKRGKKKLLCETLKPLVNNYISVYAFFYLNDICESFIDNIDLKPIYNYLVDQNIENFEMLNLYDIEVLMSLVMVLIGDDLDLINEISLRYFKYELPDIIGVAISEENRLFLLLKLRKIFIELINYHLTSTNGDKFKTTYNFSYNVEEAVFLTELYDSLLEETDDIETIKEYCYETIDNKLYKRLLGSAFLSNKNHFLTIDV